MKEKSCKTSMKLPRLPTAIESKREDQVDSYAHLANRHRNSGGASRLKLTRVSAEIAGKQSVSGTT